MPWKYKIKPSCKTVQQYMRVVKAMSLLMSVNTDHCTKAKKYADVMQND